MFDNQKAVTVRGTFLQNREFMGVFYREGYTDIEMEAGPYLSAVYEDIYPQRYPVNEIVNLFINAPYDIGVLHYASDTPYSRRQSLLSKSLSYFGVDATYACGIAILRRIFGQSGTLQSTAGSQRVERAWGCGRARVAPVLAPQAPQRHHPPRQRLTPSRRCAPACCRSRRRCS